jgi:YhcH/YjgK/YiaL family protein
MILDHLENAAFYGGLGERFRMAFDYLARTNFADVAPGRHEIDGERVSALVQCYDTRPREQGVWEVHRRHIDVQYVAAGSECMGYAPLRSLAVTEPYAPEKDCELLAGNGDFLTASAGMFAVFFPGDAHMPCLACADPQPVTKVVVKVAVG